MPIEIRELIITAEVNDQPPGRNPMPEGPEARAIRQNEKHEIIQECVEQVMEILNKQKRR
ncbi:MAG: DUF5908 family protein [Bacteroidota bacterium]